jgi:hypothetical protein
MKTICANFEKGLCRPTFQLSLKSRDILVFDRLWSRPVPYHFQLPPPSPLKYHLKNRFIYLTMSITNRNVLKAMIPLVKVRFREGGKPKGQTN